jgi:type I restriction enzyme M protein
MVNRRPQQSNENGDLNFAESLWKAADKLRGSVESAEYKHIVLGLIFLKYISDAFVERQQYLERAVKDPSNLEYYGIHDATEEKDEYLSENIFWVPPEARWSYLMANATNQTLGKLIDNAMVAIEKENPTQFRGVLPKIYARSNIDYLTLGEIINLFSTIGFGTADAISKDILGRVYEYFIGRFAQQEGKGGGEFYTPRCIVKLLVEMLEPYRGRIFDPACGSGGMFVQSIKFIQAHGGKRGDISIFGQESIDTTWRICKMNLAIRSIEGNIQLGNSYWDDKFKDLRADYILANPPFNVSEWGADRVQGDVRLKYGTPPNSNANYMWLQHFIYHLAPNGITGFVMANGSMSVGGLEGEIRKKIIEDDLVDCVIALPVQLFYTTGIPACLWFVTKNKAQKGHRDRKGETLFIDARKLFRKVDRTHNELTDEQIKQIADTYHAYRGEAGLPEYQDIPGLCKVSRLEEIRKHGYVLTPGRYVGTEEIEDDAEPFEEKMDRLTKQLAAQFEKSEELKGQIKANLEELGYGF